MPNTYPMYMCGEILVDDSLSQEAVIEDYFNNAYGKDWEKVLCYLKTLSDLFQPHLIRERDIAADEEMYTDVNVKIKLPYMNNEEALKKFSEIQGVIDSFIPVIKENLILSDKCQRKSWKILENQVPIISQFAQGLCYGAAGDMKKAQEIGMALIDYLAKNEDLICDDFDYGLIVRRIRVTFGFTANIFESIKQI